MEDCRVGNSILSLRPKRTGEFLLGLETQIRCRNVNNVRNIFKSDFSL